MWISQFVCLDAIINLEGEFMRPNRSETIFSLFKSISVLIVFAISLISGGSVGATSWIGPSEVPPMGNVAPPLNESTPFLGDVSGTYNNLRLTIAGCEAGQSLIWNEAVGSFSCGVPVISVDLLTVLNNGSDAGSFMGEVKIGIQDATNKAQLKVGGELRADWIHADAGGWNTFWGNVSIGNQNPAFYGPSSATLFVSSPNPEKNAEIDIQTGSSVGGHWAIYNEVVNTGGAGDLNELRFWKGDGNKFVIDNIGNAFAGENMYAKDFCRYTAGEPECLNNIISGIGVQFMGLTATTYNGAQGGYGGANAKCVLNYAGSHVCTSEEILQVINSGGSISGGPTDPAAWISGGPPGYTANANDCNGWKSAVSGGAAGYYGRVWDLAGQYGIMTTCNALLKFACCK